MDSITTNLVGAHFRPPAKALLACLPAGHPLWLRPEPTNEYDENAVQVLLRTASLQTLISEPFLKDELENQLASQGFDLETVMAETEWHLGFLPKAAKGNPELEAWQIGVQKALGEVAIEKPEGAEPQDWLLSCVPAQLSFNGAGKPTVVIPWPPKPKGPEHEGPTADNDTADKSHPFT